MFVIIKKTSCEIDSIFILRSNRPIYQCADYRQCVLLSVFQYVFHQIRYEHSHQRASAREQVAHLDGVWLVYFSPALWLCPIRQTAPVESLDTQVVSVFCFYEVNCTRFRSMPVKITRTNCVGASHTYSLSAIFFFYSCVFSASVALFP